MKGRGTLNKCIEIKSVSKISKKNRLLNDISISMEEGKTYGFVGNNGSGKSLLFNAICGLVSIQKGEIVVNGRVIGKDIDFIEDSGVIIESPEFISSMSGLDNLRMLAEIQNKITVDEIQQTLKIVGLDRQENKKVKHYSLGMKQRLRIAQAIMENPSILILDEPFNGLDKKGVEDIHEVLLNEKKKGKTILLTSHHESDIYLLCDHVYEIEQGTIIKEMDISALKGGVNN